MSIWFCSSCERKECRQCASAKPTMCVDPSIDYKNPAWKWLAATGGDDDPELTASTTTADDIQSRFATEVRTVLKGIEDMLIEKNRKYGNSALDPIRVFAKSDDLEQIRVRIDDKLNRYRNRQSDDDEDIINDLMGYLVLYKIKSKEDKK